MAKVIEEEENLRIAHISDCHLDTSTLRSRRLERIIAEVAGLDDVAALVVSGDIADHGKSAEYDQFFRKLPAMYRSSSCRAIMMCGVRCWRTSRVRSADT
ncbi:metallophosphoesterase [Microbacterium oxydans]|nr:metallophosphoesterase [Microbacterium oxydans]